MARSAWPDAREDLRRATLAFDQARTKEMRSDTELAIRRWRPLVASRWSLLDDFDADGRRFVVAVESSPPTGAPRKDLSERELHVMTQAHLGQTDKEIAYELGLSVSTVRVLVHRATRKLGAATRREALARFDTLTTRVRASNLAEEATRGNEEEVGGEGAQDRRDDRGDGGTRAGGRGRGGRAR